MRLLNQAIARELQVSIQYMWQHVLWKSFRWLAVKQELKRIAISEMKHAEAIAERLTYLGGVPTTEPDPIFLGENMAEMIRQDQKDEETAIRLYREVIEVSRKEGDEVTNRLFREILAEEEGHHATFSTILEEL